MSSEVAPVIAFLGAGNMAGAMISGLIAEGVPPSQLRASDPSEAALARLEAMGLSHLSTSPDALYEDADLVVAAVKPQVIPAALTAIKDQLGPRTALLSIAAGIPISSLQSQLGGDVPRLTTFQIIVRKSQRITFPIGNDCLEGDYEMDRTKYIDHP